MMVKLTGMSLGTIIDYATQSNIKVSVWSMGDMSLESAKKDIEGLH